MDSLDTTEKNKKAKKDKKRKRSPISDESENELSSKRLKGKHKKKCKKKHKNPKEKKHKKDKVLKNSSTGDKEDVTVGPEVPNEFLMKAQSMAPMSKDEWEKKQNMIRRVYDEETGRTRLIRGQGEVIEEIVSKERHQEINRQATQGDGQFFQSNIKKHIK